MRNSKEEEHIHPIRVVSQRTGVRPDVLRAWERRYKAVKPYRTETGRRLYSDSDIARLRLLKMAVDAGRRISDVASQTNEEVERLVRADQQGTAVTEPPKVRAQSVKPARYLSDALAALERLDRAEIEGVLSEAGISLSRPQLRREVLVPLIHRIGELWQDGALRVFHEHLASVVFRSILAATQTADRTPSTGPRILLTTPAGHLHELGAMLAVSAAADSGWQVLYLGPNLPADEIAAAARQSNARAVALSLVYPPNDGSTHAELRRLRRALSTDVAIIVGGRAAGTYASTLAEIQAIHAGDLSKFQVALETLSLLQ